MNERFSIKIVSVVILIILFKLQISRSLLFSGFQRSQQHQLMFTQARMFLNPFQEVTRSAIAQFILGESFSSRDKGSRTLRLSTVKLGLLNNNVPTPVTLRSRQHRTNIYLFEGKCNHKYLSANYCDAEGRKEGQGDDCSPSLDGRQFIALVVQHRPKE